MAQENTTVIPRDYKVMEREGHAPYFVVGDASPINDDGPIVAVAINVNFNIRNGTDYPSRGHAIPLHEIPFMRRAYPGGTLELNTGWVPAIRRTRTMSASRFDAELKRLSRSYITPNQNLMVQVLGANDAEQKYTLARVMRKSLELWNDIWKRCHHQASEKLGSSYSSLDQVHRDMAANSYLTVEDLERIVAVVEPMSQSLESVALEAIQLDNDKPYFAGEETTPSKSDGNKPKPPTESAASKPKDDAPPDAGDSQVVKELMLRKFSRESAQEIEAVWLACEGGEIDDELLAEVKDMQKSDGSLNLVTAKSVKTLLASIVKAQ